MSRRYISKYLLEDQQEFLQLLDQNEIDIFNFKQIESLLECQVSNLNSILDNLVDKLFLSRIERGKYCRKNFRDEKAIGCHLVEDGVIAYWSALNIHGLTEQFSNTFFIQTTKVKQDKRVFGVAYQFVKINPRKQIGAVTWGKGNHQYQITDKEKTIVDCFDLPQYAGGYAELIRALIQHDLDQDNLIAYCEAVNNLSVIKRIAYLIELTEKQHCSRFLKYAKNKVNPRYVLLDPFGLESGVFNNKWKLRLNITKEEIQTICKDLY